MRLLTLKLCSILRHLTAWDVTFSSPLCSCQYSWASYYSMRPLTLKLCSILRHLTAWDVTFSSPLCSCQYSWASYDLMRPPAPWLYSNEELLQGARHSQSQSPVNTQSKYYISTFYTSIDQVGAVGSVHAFHFCGFWFESPTSALHVDQVFQSLPDCKGFPYRGSTPLSKTKMSSLSSLQQVGVMFSHLNALLTIQFRSL